jgi:hypothetical protein
MRKLSVLVAAVAFLVASTSFAGTTPVSEKVPTTISAELGKYLANPDFEFDQNEVAKVSFMVNKDNEVVVLSVDSDNEQLISFIKARLNYQKVSAKVLKGTEYTLPVRIKQLS